MTYSDIIWHVTIEVMYSRLFICIVQISSVATTLAQANPAHMLEPS